jgi:hypothetical protein
MRTQFHENPANDFFEYIFSIFLGNEAQSTLPVVLGL